MEMTEDALMNAPYEIDYETIFKFAPVGMCISVNRVIQSSNDALTIMFGYPHGALDGRRHAGRPRLAASRHCAERGADRRARE